MKVSLVLGILFLLHAAQLSVFEPTEFSRVSTLSTLFPGSSGTMSILAGVLLILLSFNGIKSQLLKKIALFYVALRSGLGLIPLSQYLVVGILNPQIILGVTGELTPQDFWNILPWFLFIFSLVFSISKSGEGDKGKSIRFFIIVAVSVVLLRFLLVSLIGGSIR